MFRLSRREFMQASTATWLLNGASSVVPAARPEDAEVQETSKGVEVRGRNYRWEWSPADDIFRLIDEQGRVMTSGTLQPAVITQPDTNKQARKCTPGKVAVHNSEGRSFSVTYAGVNGRGKLVLTWRFEDEALWLEPVTYESADAENVVALHYFARGTGQEALPELENFYLILPGICESPALSPILTSDLGIKLTSWLGRGSAPTPGLLQQWGLPAHFFCGQNRDHAGATKSALSQYVSDAFCCGLAELPNGDFFVETREGRHAIIVDYRSDIWGHLRGPARLELGAKFYWAIGPNYYEAIRAYYRGLLRAGIVKPKVNSAAKNSTVMSPQFNCWGAEVAIGKEGPNLDEAAVNSFYEGIKTAGMKARMFVIDDKWEGTYGKLEHSAERLPHFEQFRERVRADGLRFGLWAAFMRCQDPADMGLNLSQMLHLPDGKPLVVGGDHSKYYILDFTQPEVEKVLRAQARKFAERYKPDLVKFDFGYELPPLSVAAPRDMSLAGERLMLKGLEVIVGGMREANPDLVVMYYCLSPLFSEYFDLHSPDDLFMAAGEYDFEANRRFFFSSLLGELGMPTYGSGGYDWASMPSIWFDSALIGTLGSLNSFSGDEEDEKPSPALIAKFNGLCQVLREANTFSIEPIDAEYLPTVRGGHAPSWARFENHELVGVALRTHRLDGHDGPVKFRNAVETNADVVITSKTGEALTASSRLAVVPYGKGEAVIHRAAGQPAEARVIEHYFDGNSRESRAEIHNGDLRLDLRETGASGSPIEWVEVSIRS